jgi:hypothetical protein
MLSAWRRPERLSVTRLSAANVLLEKETLEEWTERVLSRPDKKRHFEPPEETSVREHPAYVLTGRPRDLRRRWRFWLGDKMSRDVTPPSQITAWHCSQSNKLWVLDAEVSRANSHVPGDVLDSLECH